MTPTARYRHKASVPSGIGLRGQQVPLSWGLGTSRGGFGEWIPKAFGKRFFKQLTPSVEGLAPNAEIDAKYEELWDIHEDKGISHIKNSLASTSPLHPAWSGASLDDLTPVTLEQLHSLGKSSAGTFLRVTVIQPALMFTCPMTVVADDAGQRIFIYVYNSAARTTDDARTLLPVGARFALKNPFLKRLSDLWLGLRVESPCFLVRLDLLPLPNGHRLLVLGDGDFSFSSSLAQQQQVMNSRWQQRQHLSNTAAVSSAHEPAPAPATIVATSLDTREEVVEKYSRADACLTQLESLPQASVLFGKGHRGMHIVKTHKRSDAKSIPLRVL